MSYCSLDSHCEVQDRRMEHIILIFLFFLFCIFILCLPSGLVPWVTHLLNVAVDLGGRLGGVKSEKITKSKKGRSHGEPRRGVGGWTNAYQEREKRVRYPNRKGMEDGGWRPFQSLWRAVCSLQSPLYRYSQRCRVSYSVGTHHRQRQRVQSTHLASLGAFGAS